jgi:hypothetical protein
VEYGLAAGTSHGDSIQGGGSSSFTITRNAAAKRPISIPLLASEKEQPHAAKALTVRVEKSLSI